MVNNNGAGDNRLIITRSKKASGKLYELRIDSAGRLYIDGELYNDKNPSHKGVFVNIERYRKIDTGEETRKMMEERKKSEKGDTVTITDIKTPIRTEKTTVKF